MWPCAGKGRFPGEIRPKKECIKSCENCFANTINLNDKGPSLKWACFPKVLWPFSHLTVTLNKPSQFFECYLLFDHYCLTMNVGLKLRMWVFGAAGCLLIIIMLCILWCICKLFSQGHVRDQQVASFVGSIAVLTKNKGGNIGDCSAWRGPSSHSERPVESEVQHTGPTPMDRISRVESGLHCT